MFHAKPGPQKKRYKDLYLPSEWPNPAVVRLILFLSSMSFVLMHVQRDAYYHPTVDESDEPFKWGLPDLDALRE